MHVNPLADWFCVVNKMKCRLCLSDRPVLLTSDKRRRFFLCSECSLIFVPDSELVSVVQEKERYDLHVNSRQNSGYVEFLSELIPLIKNSGIYKPSILDFGSGKNAVLSSLLDENRLSCDSYDPLYGVLIDEKQKKYDVIVLCEVIEHLRNLREELRLIKSLLSERGIVVIRTRMYPSGDSFPGWWYAQDITHINFFSLETIRKVAGMMDGRLEETEFPDIFIVRRDC